MWVVCSDNIQMANFVAFFALLCFQISRGVELSETVALYDAVDNHEISFPDKNGVDFEVPEGEKSFEEEWTEEDEKWLEQIQNLLAEDSDEDYDTNYEDLSKLIQVIEELVKEYDSEKGNYEWLQEIANWFTADDGSSDEVEEGLAYFHSWVEEKNGKSGEKSQRMLQKRFSSV